MGSETTQKLPIIDFSNVDLENSTTEGEGVKSQVNKALEEYGCFEALFDKVSLELRKAIFGALQDLYDLPLQTKQRHVTSHPYHGYVGRTPQNQIYEAMGFDDPCVYENVESLTKIFWPEGNPSFSKTMHSLSEQLSTLDHVIRKMLLGSLGVEMYLEEHLKSTYYLLRTMMYSGPQTKDAKIGLPSHADKSTLTILCQNEVDGLEFQTPDGEWIKYKPSSSYSFVVLAGETLHVWSNGRVQAPTHRVMMTGNETRYTFGLFTIPKAGYIVKAPNELVDENHPLLFKPFDFGEYMKFLQTSEYVLHPLKAFYGV